MKQDDFKPCALCGKGMMHAGAPFFYTVEVAQMVIDFGAVRRQAGLEMMTGSPVLARVFSPDNDLAHAITTKKVILCSDCALGDAHIVAQLLEGEEAYDAAG